MRILIYYDPPPVERRDFDYRAVDLDTYDGPGSACGYGRTPALALADLEAQLIDRAQEIATRVAEAVSIDQRHRSQPWD
jgi:hypothetical protein